MSSSTDPIWDELQKINDKLDKVIVNDQDFKTWRRGHMERHELQCNGNSQKIDQLDVRVTDNTKQINNSLAWRHFISSVLTALVSAAALVIAAMAIGAGNG